VLTLFALVLLERCLGANLFARFGPVDQVALIFFRQLAELAECVEFVDLVERRPYRRLDAVEIPARDISGNGRAMFPGLLGRVVDEGIGLFIRCRNLRLLSADARRAFPRLRVPPLVKFLAPRNVQAPLDWRQVGADQVFIDLGQFGLIGVHTVEDRRGD